jgi:hypothetical protein
MWRGMSASHGREGDGGAGRGMGGHASVYAHKGMLQRSSVFSLDTPGPSAR